MKIKYLLGFALAIVLTSCGSGIYYQVYKVAPSNDKVVLKDNKLVFEDENCVVTYNMWEEGGNIGFSIYNKSEKNVYVNMEESFFVLNGVAYNYYKGRHFTNTLGAAGSVSTMLFANNNLSSLDSRLNENVKKEITTANFSVVYNEPKVVCIPSKTSKNFSEYVVTKNNLNIANMELYPSKKEVKTKTYTLNDTPLAFGNRIAYTAGAESPLVVFSNDFYVSDLTNSPESLFLEANEANRSPKDTLSNAEKAIVVTSDKFFVKYKQQ